MIRPAGWVKNINRLQVGDLVKCYKLKDNQFSECKVSKWYIKREKTGWRVELDKERRGKSGSKKEIIQVGADQLFYSLENGQWKKAQDLKSGEKLLRIDKGVVLVERAYEVNEETFLFEIEVDDCHNYFASYSGVLVHD